MKNILAILVSVMVIFVACNTASNSTENKTDTNISENKITSNKNSNTKSKLQQKETVGSNKNQVKKGSNKKEVTGSGKINWVNIEEVQELVKQQPKKILVDAYTDWCGWCKRMDKNTFENATIAKFVNDNFYAVKLNAENKETINFKGKNYDFVQSGRRGYNTLAKELLNGRMSYPTISFLDENLNLINAFPGYKSPQNFDALMNYINESEFEKVGFTQYKASFKSEIPDLSKNLTATQTKAKSNIKSKTTAKPKLKGKVNTNNKKVVRPNIIKPQNTGKNSQ